MSRSPLRSLHAAVVTGSLTLATTSIVLAQETVPEPVPTPADAPPPPAAYPTVTQTAPPPSIIAPPPAVVAPPPAYGPAANPSPETPTEGPVDAPQDEAEEAPWYNDFSLGMFVDAYGAIRSDSNRKRTSGTTPDGTGLPAQYPHEAYVMADGFSLAFAGIDATYSGEKFGATVSLRFGPGVNRFYFADTGPIGIDNITQAFVTYKPHEKLTLDLGQFGTLYGAEVLESWKNMNYSRGALYYAMQPFWHTGLRANLAIADSFALNAMVVNGVNNAFEGNKSPTLGLQAVITPGDVFSMALGYMAALHPRDGAEPPFHNFFDVVATITAGDFKLVGNFDLNMYKLSGADTENWWGLSVAPGYAFTEYLGAALRFEYLSDSANFLFAMPDLDSTEEGATIADTTSLTTITATLDLKPVPGSSALVIRPEFRYEMASDDYFADKDGDLTDGFWTAMLGVVVTSM